MKDIGDCSEKKKISREKQMSQRNNKFHWKKLTSWVTFVWVLGTCVIELFFFVSFHFHHNHQLGICVIFPFYVLFFFGPFGWHKKNKYKFPNPTLCHSNFTIFLGNDIKVIFPFGLKCNFIAPIATGCFPDGMIM